MHISTAYTVYISRKPGPFEKDHTYSSFQEAMLRVDELVGEDAFIVRDVKSVVAGHENWFTQ